jgi:hypothetical protein
VHVEDAVHWVAVYSELTGFLGSSELSLRHTKERYEGRLAYWRQRLNELNGHHPRPT